MKDTSTQIFEKHSSWDVEDLNEGHENRFLEKLKRNQPKKKKNKWLPISIAASIFLGFGLIYFFNFNRNEVNTLSPQVQETHDYFSDVIHSELKSLKEQKNPQTILLIDDALKEIKTLEKDYALLEKEISKNGENKQVIFAMITNMQTRISFLKTVLVQVETINNFKTNTNENQL